MCVCNTHSLTHTEPGLTTARATRRCALRTRGGGVTVWGGKSGYLALHVRERRVKCKPDGSQATSLYRTGIIRPLAPNPSTSPSPRYHAEVLQNRAISAISGRAIIIFAFVQRFVFSRRFWVSACCSVPEKKGLAAGNAQECTSAFSICWPSSAPTRQAQSALRAAPSQCSRRLRTAFHAAIGYGG